MVAERLKTFNALVAVWESLRIATTPTAIRVNCFMAEIIIKGHKCLIDDEDVERVSQYPLTCSTVKSTGDVYIRIYLGEKSHSGVHRFIMGITDRNIFVDHINGNTLDNRKCNLRPCTRTENIRNRGKRTPGSSKYKGVWKMVYNGLKGQSVYWRAVIGDTSLGSFKSENEAAIAFNNAAVERYGEFARINIID